MAALLLWLHISTTAIAIALNNDICILSYPNHDIGYISSNIDIEPSIIYLGNKISTDKCEMSCIDLNYIYDTTNHQLFNDVGYDWTFNTAECSIVVSPSDTPWSWISLTPDIISKEYILQLQLTITSGVDETGIQFKSNTESGNAYRGYYFGVVVTDSSFITGYNPTFNKYKPLDSHSTTVAYNTKRNLSVHVNGILFTTYSNGQEIYTNTGTADTIDEFVFTQSYAGVYAYDAAAIFHSFKVTFPNPDDNADEKLCAAYIYDTKSGDCYGYYGNDYTVIETTLSVDLENTYDSAIIHHSSCVQTTEATDNDNNPTHTQTAITNDISSTVNMTHSGSTTADEQIIKTTATSDSATATAITNAISESTTAEGHETDTMDTSVTETYALRTTKYKSTISKATEVEQHSTMFAGSITTHSLTADEQIITTTNTAFILTQSQSMPRTNTESTHDRNSTKASLSTGIIIAIIVIVSILTVLCFFIVTALYRSMTVKHFEQFNDMHHLHHDDQQSGALKEEMKHNISIQPSVGIRRVNNAHKNRDSDSERLYDVYVVSNLTKRKMSDSEHLYTKNPISTDTMDMTTTANASDTNTKMSEENRVEANDVVEGEEGAARLRSSGGGEPKCNACRLVREGKVDDYDGEFYCFVCWSQYEMTDGSGNATSK